MFSALQNLLAYSLLCHVLACAHELSCEDVDAEKFLLKRKPISLTSRTASPTSGYVIVSPTSCPPAQPTGNITEQNSALFSKMTNMTYDHYTGQQYTIQASGYPSLYMDLSNPDAISMSIDHNTTLILHSDGTFEAFTNGCELLIVDSWRSEFMNFSSTRDPWGVEERDDTLASIFCSDARKLCDKTLSKVLKKAGANKLCSKVGGRIGALIGGRVGFLGNLAGPEVGIPTTIIGTVIGKLLGRKLCNKGLSMVENAVCNYTICSAPDRAAALNSCSIGGPEQGSAIFCCSGDCLDGTHIGDPGLCLDWLNECIDPQGSTPSCSSTQVFFPGTDADWVDTGDGDCWADCQWQQQNWSWRCCDCPKNYEPIPGASQCQTGEGPLAQSPDPLPCMGCTMKKKLDGNTQLGYFCNW